MQLNLFEILHTPGHDLRKQNVRVQKSAQKIILQVLNEIKNESQEQLMDWVRDYPADNEGFELIMLFLKSKEYRSSRKFAWRSTDLTVNQQFQIFYPRLRSLLVKNKL